MCTRATRRTLDRGDGIVVRGLRARWPEIGRTAGAAALLAGLTQLVWRANEFSHDARFLNLLLDRRLELWGLVALWVGLLGLRWWLDPDGTRALLGRPAAFLGAGVAVSCLLLVPFTTPAFSHFTHPGLSAAVAWTSAPGARTSACFTRASGCCRASSRPTIR